jgi:hypothetical protein
MMEGHEYIFFIQDSNYRFWQLDADDNLLLNANTYALDKAPLGWEDIAIQNVRNDKYFGVDRSATVPLRFVKDGAKILKSIFLQFGHEADGFLTVCKRRLNYQGLTGYAYEYRQIYKGQIDFSTYKHTGAGVSCSLLEDGLAKYLKANENTPYEIDMYIPEAILVTMDGVTLQQRATYFVSNGGLINDNFQHVLDLGLLGTEAVDQIGAVSSQRTTFTNNTELVGSNQYFYSTEGAAADTQFTIKYSLGFTCTLAPGITPNPLAAGRLLVRQFDLTGTTATDVNIIEDYGTGGTLYQHHQLDGEITFTVPPNRHLFMANFLTIAGVIATGDSADGSVLWTYDNKDEDIIKTSSTFRFRATKVRHLTAQYIFSFLVNKITQGKYRASISKLLKEQESILFTCGDAIRESTDANGNITQIMKISLWEFFQFWDYRFNTGMTEREAEVLLEIKEDLIDEDHIIDLPEPALTPSFECDGKALFNEYEYGYPEISNEVGVLNGKEEFNCKTLRSLGTTISPKRISRVSPIIASCYEQENIRIRLLQKTTTDSKTDNKLYVNKVEPLIDGVLTASLDRSLNASVDAGLTEKASIWNLYLRPDLMLQSNGSFIRSSLYKCENKTLNFISADRNSSIVFAGVADNRAINVGSLNAPYIYPFITSADFAAPDDLIQNLDINPLQVFRFPLNGFLYTWLARKVSSGSSSKRSQGYELVSLASNNLLSLKNYEG